MQSEHIASQPDAPIPPASPQPDFEPANGFAHSRSSTLSVVIGGAAFLVVLLAVNHAIFTVPIMEYSDFAVNGLQIEKAKHFRELLGNYSRWGFHHPGPGFFYIFAFGEGLFHDVLHLVPAEMNAHILTIILLNTAFLFGTIGILAKRCRSRLFTPAALSISLFFVYILNRTVPASAILSIWMPHVLLFCFLFFVTVCAAVAMGEVSKLPLLALSGLLLVHGHTAQPLFVGTLSILSLATVWFRQGRFVGLRPFLSANRTALAVSLALCVLFATPILLDVVVHKPNNIQNILEYSSHHKGLQNGLVLSLKYEASFLAFVPDTEVVLGPKSTHLASIGGSKPYVARYWCLGCLMIGLLVGVYARQRDRVPPFFKYVAMEILVVFLLFYVWTLKMAGPLFNFNGYFIYSMQLLALLAMAALILDGLQVTVRPLLAFALCAVIPASMFTAKSGFKNTWTGDPETERLYASIPANVGPVHLTFPAQDWLTIAGIADRMKHEHSPFCVDMWASGLGQENICSTMDGLTNLVMTRVPRECKFPCRMLLKDDQVEFQLVPYPFLKLPFAIKPNNILTLNTNFYGNDEAAVWSSHKSTVYFRLDRDFSDASHIHVTVLGTAMPGRPAQISLNGHPLGTIVAGPSSSDFVVDRSVLLPGTENQLVIQVDNGAPVGGDPRSLGFYWAGMQLEAAN